jgi:uncharacterized protein
METPNLQFPCDFPIKILGHNHPQFADEVVATLRQHLPTMTSEAVQTRHSSSNNYLAITARLTVPSQVILNTIYKALQQCKHVVMVL